jgi:hypothetical protein
MLFLRVVLLIYCIISITIPSNVTAQSPDVPVAQVIYLVGNSGNDKRQTTYSTLEAMKDQLRSERDASTVIFLGNLFHPDFFPEGMNHPEEYLDNIKLAQILKDIKDNTDNVFMIPGPNEWSLGKKTGYQSTIAYETMIENYLFGKGTFLPNRGCPGPEEIELGDNTVLFFIDTQWWLNRELWNIDWQNQECGVESQGDLLLLLKDAINRHEGKHIIVAGYHPILSFGKHNGYLPGYIHLTPPLFGSLHVLFKNVVGYADDFANPTYKSLIRGLRTIFKGNQDIVYVSSHESSLQFIKNDNIYQIISGTGSSAKYVKSTNQAFTKNASGYMKLIIYMNNEIWLECWEVKEDLSREKILESYLYTLDSTKFLDTDYDMKKLAGEKVPIQASVSYGLPKKRPGLMGNNYRAEWIQVVRNIDYLDIGTAYGGLEVVKRGGGMQTKSLRLENKQGRQYVIRSIEKYPEAAVPEELKNTIATQLVKDFISSSHPYAAIAIPSMADAVGVYHTNPRILYLPNEPKLGIYEEEFGSALYLFEERPMSKQRNLQSFGNARDIISTNHLLEDLYDNNEIHVDQLFTLKSRLFDMWIGDWDRHEDQWRWAEFKMDKGKDRIYRPIPRDRDQAFFYNDGFIIKAGARQPGLSKFQGFDYKIKDIKGFNYNARYFDRSFLTEPSWAEWDSTINFLKRNLRDEVIYQGISKMPQEIYKHSGDVIIEKLKKRRDELHIYAREYYEFLSKEVTIVGSNEKEWFNIERLNDQETRVTVWDLKQKTDRPDFKMFERTFENDITRELRLFGLDDDDLFTITGNVHKSPTVRIIGGFGRFGNDKIRDESSVSGLNKKTIVYDTKKGIHIDGSGETRDKTSSKIGINYYDRTAFKYDYWMPLVYVDISPDDGLFISADFKVYKFGFRKDPYKWLQKYSIRYSPSVNSWKFNYEGDYIHVLGNWDINVSADVFYPRYTDYYYGLGNETAINEETRKEEYYHFQFSRIIITPLLRYKFDNGKQAIEVGPYLDLYRVNDVRDEERKFLEDFPDADNDKWVPYTGAIARYTIDTRNDDHFPLFGLHFRNSVMPVIDTSNDSIFFTKITSDFSFYQSTGGSINTTFAVRIGGSFNLGNYMFYQANDLGGKYNLRGHRRMRFSGDHNVFLNLEARMRLFRFNMPLFPGSVGLYGFFDTGRVWYKNREGIDPTADSGKSTIWHAGYGGGIWVAPFRRYVFSLDLSTSLTDQQLLLFLRYGFFF